MRTIICQDAHRLLDDFLYSALSSWSSGRIANIMGYSEEALIYRAQKLGGGIQEAEAIFKPQWGLLSLDDCFS